MANTPFFTILTASLNMGNSLKKTIESIQKQRFQRLQHIVVDGKSTDNTLEILRSFEDSYNLTWISEPDQGVPDAFNKAIRLAKGLYVIAIQADDYLLDETVLEKVYKIISSKKADIYSFPVMKEIAPKETKQINPIPLLWWIRFRNIFPHQGVFVHRGVFERIGHFNLNYTITEDYDFLYRALNANCKVVFETMPVAFMGGKGPSSMDKFLRTRLGEEYRIHIKNEKNTLWRLLQLFFWVFYYPYKIIIKSKGNNRRF